LTALEVAKTLTGSTQPSIETHEMSGGIANLGCFLHTASGENGEVRFVEKRTTRKREQLFSNKYALIYATDPVPISPRIYAMHKEGAVATIFMEYVEGEPIKPSMANAAKLGFRLADLVRPEVLPIKPSLLTLQKRKLGSLSEQMIAENDDLRPFFLLLDRLGVKRESSPVVPSHNDLSLTHVLLSGGNLRLVDWGQFSGNLVGADFHHFIAACAARKLSQDFVDTVVISYTSALASRGIEIKSEEVMAGAQYYALLRSLFRYSQKRTDRYLDSVKCIYSILG
jgi:hypothetical protein